MIRQRFATRVTTKRAFVFDLGLKDNDSQPREKVVEEDNSRSLEIGTPFIQDVVSKKNEKVEKLGNGEEEDFYTPNSPVCSEDEILNEILKRPPLGTSTPRIAVPQNRSKQPTHYPKSLFQNTSSKLARCSPIRKYAIFKPSSQNQPSLRKATGNCKSVENVPITATSQKKSASSSPTKTVLKQSVSSPVKGVKDVLESPNSLNPENRETNSASMSQEVSIQNLPIQDSLKSVTNSESPRSTKSSSLRSPKVNKVAKLRPRAVLSSPISRDVSAQSAVKSQNDQTPSESRIKHISLSKSAIKQVSIDSESPFPETKNSSKKVISPKKSNEILSNVSTSKKASQSTKAAKTNKGTKSKNKVPREVRFLMEQCYKMQNLKSHYDSDTGEVEFELYTRSHKPICYNVDTMLAKIDTKSVPKKRKAKSKSDVFNFSGCTVGKKRQQKPQKITKNPKKKMTSQPKKTIPEDSGNSSASFIIKRKKPATKTISTDENDDDENIFIQKKRKVSQDSDSGYCKDNGGTIDLKKNSGAVRSKRSLYTRNYDDFDYDVSPSTSTTSNEKHFVKSMKHLVKKADFRKVRKTSKKR